MELIIDDDVKSVAEFMQSCSPATKLVSVAEAVANIAPILWGQYESQAISALRLAPLPITNPRVKKVSFPGYQAI